MSKINVAVLAGGYSSEWEISMQSADMVISNLSTEKYEPYLVRIRRDGWNVISGEKEFLLDLNHFSFHDGNREVKFDVAFNAIHGDPGENGLLQGYFESLGIKHTSSSMEVSALSFAKWQFNVILRELGFTCAKSLLVREDHQVDADVVEKELGWPVFVKPNRSGSSFGVAKVKSRNELNPAIEGALKEDKEVLIERFMDGREIACGVFRSNGKIIALPPTEIISENEFFDYEAKYLGKSNEITPAEISEEQTKNIQEISRNVYSKIRASGIIRVDFMLMGDTPKIIEVNTVPGLSKESIVPKQVRCAGYTLTEFYDKLLSEALQS